MTGETVQQVCTFNLTCPLWQILHSPAIYVTMVATHLIPFNFTYLKIGFLTDGSTLKITVYGLCSCRLNGHFFSKISCSWIRNVTSRMWSTPDSFEWCVNQMHMILKAEICTHTHTQSHAGLWLFIFQSAVFAAVGYPPDPRQTQAGWFWQFWRPLS